MTDNLLNFLDDINKKALKHGATECDSIVIDDATTQVGVRVGKLEECEYSRGKSFGIRVFVGKKHAIVSSSDFSLENTDNIINKAIQMATNSLEDPLLSLAEEGLYNGNIDLNLFDSSEITTKQMQEKALECENAALQVKGIVNSSGAEVSQSKTYIALATSKGFAKSYKASTFSISTAAVAGSENGMETDYDYHTTRYLSDLKDAKIIGINAANNAIQKLNPKKIATTEAQVIYPARFAARLLGEFASCINGASIARKSSFLLDMMEKQIFSSDINIFDDPLMVRGQRSRIFDSEGLATQKLHVVENGVLKTWIMDLRSAKQLGLKSTASASRGIASNPSPSTSNFYLQNGKATLEEMIKNTTKGLIVTSLFGGGVNGLTGDYSQGASGLWVENGEVQYPVSEITLASNLKDIFISMIPANDLEFKAGTNSPSLMIPKMTIAGS